MGLIWETGDVQTGECCAHPFKRLVRAVAHCDPAAHGADVTDRQAAADLTCYPV